METFHLLFQINQVWLLFTLPMRDGNSSVASRSISFFCLFTLPMRDGNHRSRKFSAIYFLLFTLPMRDGNTSPFWIKVANSSSFYASYEGWKPSCDGASLLGALIFLRFLWGMETRDLLNNSIVRSFFLRFLWGMETAGRSFQTRKNQSFLRFLWGMETLQY